MFSKAISRSWSRSNQSAPSTALLTAQELVVDSSSKLIAVDRAPGQNVVGMVAWRMHWLTPEYPDGRDVIVIANDITVDAGSFSVDEDLLFCRGTSLSFKYIWASFLSCLSPSL